MTMDLSNVPRRLRRFYRHNQPVPEELAHIGEKEISRPSSSSATQPMETNDNEEDSHEPWMNASPQNAFPVSPAQNEKILSRREQLRMRQTQNDNSPSQTGMFSRVLQSGNNPPLKPIDHALGLHGKQHFEERLPAAGEKVIQPATASTAPSTPKNPDLVDTLNELKRLAATNTDEPKSSSSTGTPPVSLSSFHFTPPAGAPNPVEPPKYSSANLETDKMSPRQRMEMRRMRSGESAFGAAGGGEGNSEKPKEIQSANSTLVSSAPAPPGETKNPPADVPAHIRRRLGQVIQPGDEMESPGGMGGRDADGSRDSIPPEKEDIDFKELVGENKPKRKKPANKDEDEDFSLEEDLDAEISQFEDEK